LQEFIEEYPESEFRDNANATVTVCHTGTKDLSKFTKQADIIISAAGRPNTITSDMVKDGVVIIDVGVNRVDGKLIGDCDFDDLKDIASFITPVPGGVGPMTITSLLQNTIECFKRSMEK
jgi:methylenetetrahydrofolate dehydrogenase (NADP+)/methenyltetrahydrofolate cyclohydrolase